MLDGVRSSPLLLLQGTVEPTASKPPAIKIEGEGLRRSAILCESVDGLKQSLTCSQKLKDAQRVAIVVLLAFGSGKPMFPSCEHTSSPQTPTPQSAPSPKMPRGQTSLRPMRRGARSTVAHLAARWWTIERADPRRDQAAGVVPAD